MRLSKRIYKLAESVSSGSMVADIGTDHGYVPMLLIKNNISPHVIMSDISAESLSKAKETFELAGLSDRVDESDFRVGDGLSVIDKGEADEIIIAGLGGHTIVNILAADEDKSKSFSRLILQPRKYSGSLRYYLCTHGWKIESEALASEGKFACEIITAVPVDLTDDNKISEIYPEDDIRWKYPEPMVSCDAELAKLRIEWKIFSIEKELINLEKANFEKTDTEDNKKQESRADLMKQLRSDLKYLKALIKAAGNYR